MRYSHEWRDLMIIENELKSWIELMQVDIIIKLIVSVTNKKHSKYNKLIYLAVSSDEIRY